MQCSERSVAGAYPVPRPSPLPAAWRWAEQSYAEWRRYHEPEKVRREERRARKSIAAQRKRVAEGREHTESKLLKKAFDVLARMVSKAVANVILDGLCKLCDDIFDLLRAREKSEVGQPRTWPLACACVIAAWRLSGTRIFFAKERIATNRAQNCVHVCAQTYPARMQGDSVDTTKLAAVVNAGGGLLKMFRFQHKIGAVHTVDRSHRGDTIKDFYAGKMAFAITDLMEDVARKAQRGASAIDKLAVAIGAAKYAASVLCLRSPPRVHSFPTSDPAGLQWQSVK